LFFLGGGVCVLGGGGVGVKTVGGFGGGWFCLFWGFGFVWGCTTREPRSLFPPLFAEFAQMRRSESLFETAAGTQIKRPAETAGGQDFISIGMASPSTRKSKQEKKERCASWVAPLL